MRFATSFCGQLEDLTAGEPLVHPIELLRADALRNTNLVAGIEALKAGEALAPQIEFLLRNGV